jgi:hypothetical protein
VLDADLLFKDHPNEVCVRACVRRTILILSAAPLIIPVTSLASSNCPDCPQKDEPEAPLPGPACESPTHTQLSASALEIELAAR